MLILDLHPHLNLPPFDGGRGASAVASKTSLTGPEFNKVSVAGNCSRNLLPRFQDLGVQLHDLVVAFVILGMHDIALITAK